MREVKASSNSWLLQYINKPQLRLRYSSFVFSVKVIIKCPLKSLHFVHSKRLLTIQNQKKNPWTMFCLYCSVNSWWMGWGGKQQGETIKTDKPSLSGNCCWSLSRSSRNLGPLKSRSGYCSWHRLKQAAVLKIAIHRCATHWNCFGAWRSRDKLNVRESLHR